ncbi:hypothetical protein [Methylacidiphilum kamchatkense]|uniref:Uncharacterized protein n=1 Tax=Methylacidiphilum kamchatkense Kam1 TaxID=1202785 RepID=A0A516TNG4_9BACT|nr:hypothetical protein [Methylacidiphilum kamchatkense]QDQ42765.1 hypothetical protein kam1_1548 [Methylacidiphilum kamchatkense Kam1]
MEKSENCQSATKSCCEKQEDLIEYLLSRYKETSGEAWEEVFKEILKEKIRAKWGAELENGAEHYVEAMDKSWQAKVAAAKALYEFKEGMIKAIFYKE